ncbi:S-phase kinase-associated protein 2 [Cylas formicarius]|uniref:S-phase kinase-associated protein 2 n=1 Tax=Cylas formicarius TaxID=197179 RepID=UPI0029585154|nr:S-phase kinase-associated protein 2 [Cylas formicarius]
MSCQNVLKPIDVNIDYSPPAKRARFDDEPDVSPKSLWSNEKLCLGEYGPGIGRLDCDLDEVTTDEDTIFSRTESVSIDVSCASLTPNTKEKQLTVLESVLSRDTLEKIVVEDKSEVITKPIRPSNRTSYFDILSDEVILHILKWLPKSYLSDIALVCRRFYRLTQDESLWTRMDLGNKHFRPGDLGKILSRQVVVLRMAKSKIMDNVIMPNCKAYSPDFQVRLLYLDLSMVHISLEGLTTLFSKCKRLRKLSLENVPVNDEVLLALSSNRDIEVINFAMCTGIQQTGLKHLLGNCKKIRELNLGWTYLNQDSIQYICESLPSTVDRLNMSGCRKLLLDKHVQSLVARCPRLRELDLSDCTSITGDSITEISSLDELNFLALSRCYTISYKMLVRLKKLKNLSYLDIHGGYIDADELKTVQYDLGHRVQINKFRFSSVARPTVGMRKSSIWNIRVRD